MMANRRLILEKCLSGCPMICPNIVADTRGATKCCTISRKNLTYPVLLKMAYKRNL